MNLISIFLSLSQLIILVIIFYLIFYYLYPSNHLNITVENFTNSIQHNAYVCKTHHEIFDLFYLDLYKNLYHNHKINLTLKQSLQKLLRKPRPTPKNKNIKQNNSLQSVFTKPNTILHIWPINTSISNLNFPNTDHFLACQNDFMKSYLTKSSNNIPHSNIDNFYLLASLTFTKQQFTHIISNHFNLYKFTFKEQLKLLENLAFWTKNNGFIILTLFDDSLFQTCNKQNIFLSSKHSTNERQSGKISFDNYSVSTNLICSDADATYKNITVKESVKFKHKSKKRIYEYCLNITPLSKIIKKLDSLNFHIKQKIPLSQINNTYDKQFIYIFKKNN